MPCLLRLQGGAGRAWEAVAQPETDGWIWFELAATRLTGTPSLFRGCAELFYFPSTFMGDHDSINPFVARAMKKMFSVL